MGDLVPMSDDLTGHDWVTGGSGVRLHVRTAGPVDAPPVVLLHGWAQTSRAWTHQLTGSLARSFRLYAADLRGHGASDRPETGYDLAAEWAADVSALLDLAGRPAVLAGWSYGGLVITDYLRERGTDRVAGLVYVGAITELGRGRHGGRIGSVMRAALPDALSADPAVARPALVAFASGMPGAHQAPSRFAEAVAEDALRVPCQVRAALFARDVASAEVLAAIDVPTLVLHGTRDEVVLPAAAEYAAGLIPGATLTWFDRIGHLPFAERAGTFDRAVADHLKRCFTPAGGTV